MSRSRIHRMLKTAGAAALAFAVSACASAPDPVVSAKPSGQPIRTSTSVTEALACMDDMMLARGIKNIPITIKGVPDATGNARVGTRDMLISALMKMSEKSSAFLYTDFQSIGDPYSANDFDFTGAVTGPNPPRFFIRGAISQFDEGVASKSTGGGARIGAVQIGTNSDSTASVITVDMNLGLVATGQILPGASASNSIAFRRSGSGADASAEIKKNGVFFQYAINQSEGMAHAVRTLIEFNAIELAGEMTGAPYWRCLGMMSTNPDVEKSLRRTYDRLDDDERANFARKALTDMRRLDPAAPGQGVALADALGRFQTERRLPATGRLDFPTYAALTDQASFIDLRKSILADLAPPPPPSPIQLSLMRTAPTTPPKLGDIVRLSAVTNKDGYLYCYLRDADGAFARVFPNRWQPNALVRAKAASAVPSADAGFDIVVDRPGKEESIVCFASTTEFGPGLPEALRKDDLEPIRGLTLEALVKAVQAISGQDLAAQEIKYAPAP